MRQRFSLQSIKPTTVMGILNVTPDSFADGGKYDCVNTAAQTALRMQALGAGIIDIGGESTRPGAEVVSIDDELDRVIPVIELIRKHSNIPISIDTSKAEVMRAAIEAGADMINDVNALQAIGALDVAVEFQVPVCLMHMRGTPKTMQSAPEYYSVVDEVLAFLLDRASLCINAGLSATEIALDPGFGFGKTVEHNFQLFAALPQFLKSSYPLLVGVSRKSMLGAATGKDVEQRLAGSIAAATMVADLKIHILRVHDVEETVDAVNIVDAVHLAKTQIQ